MSLLIRFILNIFGVTRFISNENKIDKANNIAKKLEEDLNYRKSRLEGLSSIVGSRTDANYSAFFNAIKEQAPSVKTNKHEVKSVVDIDENTFLIFALMNENVVESTSLSTTKIANSVTLRFFKVTKHPLENKVVMRTKIPDDNFEKLTLTRFYNEFEIF